MDAEVDVRTDFNKTCLKHLKHKINLFKRAYDPENSNMDMSNYDSDRKSLSFQLCPQTCFSGFLTERMQNDSKATTVIQQRYAENIAAIQYCSFDDPTEVAKPQLEVSESDDRQLDRQHHSNIHFRITMKTFNNKFLWNCLLHIARFQVVSFAPFGFGSVVCNAIIIISIVANNSLRRRKEFRIINALAFADFIEGLATFIGGVYRFFVIYAHLKDTQFTPLQCMLLPQSWMWRWSDTATAMMLLVLSLDRLISVLLPLKYLHYGKCYMRLMIGTPYIISLFFAIAAWNYPLHKNGTLSMMCMTREFISSEFYQYSKYTSSLASVLSVIVYIPLLVVMRSQLKFISEKISYSQVDRKRKAQLRVTATIALSSLSTLFLDALPRAVGMYGELKDNKAQDKLQHIRLEYAICKYAQKIVQIKAGQQGILPYSLLFWAND
uniref:G_PROTEIN_RECEP_F1_2 domain-containing protein n=1 Tax=Syphacia muris TaxID=451379 RepID=A0A158R512_9BILA